MSIKVLMNGRVLTALVMLTIFVLMTVLALDFPLKSRLIPMMIGIPAILLALVQLVIEYRAVTLKSDAAELAKPEKEEKEGQKDEKLMFLWTFLFFIGILCFGFVYASPVLVFGFLYFGSKESLKVSIISAVATWLVIYVSFVQWFQIPLFSGLILEWLLG